MNANERERLEQEVQELRQVVERLRMSRRVLMNLLASQAHGHDEAVRSLELENEKLRRKNARMARTVWTRSVHAETGAQRADG